MVNHLVPVPADFSSAQILALAIVGMGVGLCVIISLAGIIVPAWASVSKVRMETALKQQMLERGMSAEEILSLLGPPGSATSVVDHPCASEIVIERDEEWHPGFVLKRDGDRYFVHYVGGEMSENEWVSVERIRFAESSRKSCGTPWHWTDPARGVGASSWCANTEKPKPVDLEV